MSQIFEGRFRLDTSGVDNVNINENNTVGDFKKSDLILRRNSAKFTVLPLCAFFLFGSLHDNSKSYRGILIIFCMSSTIKMQIEEFLKEFFITARQGQFYKFC